MLVMYSITSIAQYLSDISNFLDLRTEVKWSEHFKSITKYSGATIYLTRIEMDFIETEVGTLS